MHWDQHCCQVFHSCSSQYVLVALVHYGNSECDDGGWCFVKKKKKKDISDDRSEAEEK